MKRGIFEAVIPRGCNTSGFIFTKKIMLPILMPGITCVIFMIFTSPERENLPVVNAKAIAVKLCERCTVVRSRALCLTGGSPSRHWTFRKHWPALRLLTLPCRIPMATSRKSQGDNRWRSSKLNFPLRFFGRRPYISDLESLLSDIIS